VQQQDFHDVLCLHKEPRKDGMEFAELIKTTRVDNVILRKMGGNLIEGTLCLTSHHLIFSSRVSESDEILILYMSIEDVKKKLSGAIGNLTIICKDFTSFKLRIPGIENAANVAASIEALSTLENQMWYYPFFYRLDFTIIQNGWELFSMRDELDKIIKSSSDWVVSSVNTDFKISRSYPEMVIVAKGVSDQVIEKSAAFRSDGRFPVLSYLHKRNNMPLMRSSQPLCGQQGRRCKEDEAVLSSLAQKLNTKGFILDTRTSSTINSHKSKGGGSESKGHYPQWKRVTLDIDRYSSLPDSVGKLYAACADKKTGAWLSNLESSGWLSMVEAVLRASLTIVDYLETEDSPVLVHGDNGMDMTLVLTSLTQILLDPECRTIIGFQSLILREWLWAGHPFSKRNKKLGVNLARYKGQGSVFLLFLDAVHQVINQYPTSFEYNEELLCFISFHSYASPYGTFLFDNEFQRKSENVASKTTSLWSYLYNADVIQNYTNPPYERNEIILLPSAAPQSLNLWSNMFLKWAIGLSSKQSVHNKTNSMKQKNKQLKDEAYALQRECAELQAELASLMKESEEQGIKD